MNRAILLGTLGRDAEEQFTRSGKPYCRLSLATNKRWKDQNGNLQEETQWHNVVVWGKEGTYKYLTKGAQVLVEGEITYGKYTDKEGVTRYSTSIQVGFGGSINPFCGGKRSEQSGGRREERREEPQNADDAAWGAENDDIPF
jgi:single-strand DNA-binding protein